MAAEPDWAQTTRPAVGNDRPSSRVCRPRHVPAGSLDAIMSPEGQTGWVFGLMRFVQIPVLTGALFRQLVRYGLVSGLALAVDVAILWVLVNREGWFYLPASAVAFVTGATVAYLLSVRFVFNFRQIHNRPLEFGYFVMLGVAGLLVNTVALLFAVGAVGLSIVAAKALAAGCTFATNFTLRRQLLFAPPEIS